MADKCTIIKRAIDEAENAQELSYAFEVEQALKSVMIHPDDITAGYLRSSNKKEVEAARKAHISVWNRLMEHEMRLGRDTGFNASPITRAKRWQDFLHTYFPTTFGIGELTALTPIRMGSIAKAINRELDLYERMYESNLPNRGLTFKERVLEHYLPRAFSTFSKDRTGLVWDFVDKATSFTEAQRNFAYEYVTRIGGAQTAFSSKVKSILSDNLVSPDFVMDGFEVLTTFDNWDFRLMKFHGSKRKDNGAIVHILEGKDGTMYEAPYDKVSREEIQNGMVEKYMNELMDEIRAGDTRYIEFSNQEEQSSHDKKAVSDIFGRMTEKSKLGESSGEVHTIEKNGIEYQYVLIKQPVGDVLEGHGHREVYKAYVISHKDTRDEGAKIVYYRQKENKGLIHNVKELFSDQNGYWKASQWGTFGNKIAKVHNKYKPIEHSVDKQPIDFHRMDNQPHPLLVGDNMMPPPPGPNVQQQLSFWQTLAEFRNILKDLAVQGVKPSIEEASKSIATSTKDIRLVPKKLGWDNIFVPDDEKSVEAYIVKKILNLYNATSSLSVDKNGDIHTRNSYFSMQKENYSPLMWEDDVAIGMAGDGMKSIALQLQNPELSEEQREELEEAVNDLKDFISMKDTKLTKDNPEIRGRINLGSKNAMLKHRKHWTDPTRRRKDGRVLMDYVNKVAYGVQTEALTALALKNIVLLAKSSGKGNQPSLLQTDMDGIINMLKLAINDPTPDASMPLPSGGKLKYDNTRVAGLLNWVSKAMGWDIMYDEAAAQKFITTARGLTSGNLLGMFSAMNNRTQSINEWVVVTSHYFHKATTIMGKENKIADGVDWNALIDYYGTNQLVTALADIMAPMEEVGWADKGFFPVPLPIISLFPATAARRLYDMKVYGNDGFIEKGIPEIDEWLESVESSRIDRFNYLKNKLKEKGLTSKQRKAIHKILRAMDFEWRTNKKSYQHRRNIKKLREYVVDLMRTPDNQDDLDKIDETVIRAQINALFGHVEENRIKKIVAFKLSWLPVGRGSWLTFTEGEQYMRAHAVISHMLQLAESGYLGKWDDKKVEIEYINPVSGEKVSAKIPKIFTSQKAMDTARRLVRNEFFGMTKVHMGEALAGAGDLIWLYKGYPINQMHYDWRAARSFMDGSLYPGHGIQRVISEMGKMSSSTLGLSNYDPYDNEGDPEARAFARLLMSRVAVSVIMTVADFVNVARAMMFRNGGGFRNIARGAEDPALRIATRVLGRLLFYMLLDDEDKAVEGIERDIFDIVRLFMPLWLTLPFMQLYFGKKDADHLLGKNWI